MGRTLRGLALLTLALLVIGASSCEARLVSPSGGYLIIDNVFAPVRIHTTRLKGAGRIDALLREAERVLGGGT